jgi:hypothetical protein
MAGAVSGGHQFVDDFGKAQVQTAGQFPAVLPGTVPQKLSDIVDAATGDKISRVTHWNQSGIGSDPWGGSGTYQESIGYYPANGKEEGGACKLVNHSDQSDVAWGHGPKYGQTGKKPDVLGWSDYPLPTKWTAVAASCASDSEIKQNAEKMGLQPNTVAALAQHNDTALSQLPNVVPHLNAEQNIPRDRVDYH